MSTVHDETLEVVPYSKSPAHLETNVMLGWKYRALQGCRLSTLWIIPDFKLWRLQSKSSPVQWTSVSGVGGVFIEWTSVSSDYKLMKRGSASVVCAHPNIPQRTQRNHGSHGNVSTTHDLLSPPTTLPIIIGLAWLIIPQPWSWTVFNMTFNSWRLYIALCTLPSLMAGIFISFYDESPKFLMSRGNSEEALQVLRKIYAVNTGRHPDTYPVKVITFEKSQVAQKPTSPPTSTTPSKQIVDLIKSGCKQATPLFKAPHLTSAALVFSIQFGSLLSMNTIRLWMPQLFFIMEDFSKLQATSVDDYSLDSFSICEMLAYTDNIAAVAAANRSLSALSGNDACTV
ncbi:unnamed protein product, partial [Timema podura]|nr:unnamed protein product [Timema podura]